MVIDGNSPLLHSPDTTTTTFDSTSTWSHTKGNPNTNSKSKSRFCKFFNKGICKFGDSCKFIHDHRNRPGLTPPISLTHNSSYGFSPVSPYYTRSARLLNHTRPPLYQPTLPFQLAKTIHEEAKETIPSTSETSNLRKDTTHKIKTECQEESVDTVQTLTHCEHATTDRVNLQGHHTEDGEKKVSSNDPPMPSKSVTEVMGKRKRNNEQQEVPRKFQREFMHVKGYRVKKINAPILEAIFKKHGDIASDCVVKTTSVRESILEVVCEVVKRIQTNDVATIVSEMEETETQVLDAEATNMKVAWLRAHLEAIQKRAAVQKKSTVIVKMKANTSLVKRAAKMDLEERRIELLTAQERLDTAEKCVKVLDIVEMKLNDNFVESEAENHMWPEQPIL